jgi:hypothetical protein
MNAKHLFIASLVGGLVSTILVNTPFLNLINLLVCAGFWIGPIVAVWLYRRLASAPALGQALVIGLLAGAWHGLFGLLLSPFGLAGAGALLSGFRTLLHADNLADLESAFTGLGALLFNLIGVLIDLAFGLVGGLIGAVFFGARRATA